MARNFGADFQVTLLAARITSTVAGGARRLSSGLSWGLYDVLFGLVLG